MRAWAPGEPPLEDGNTESLSLTLPPEPITTLRATRGVHTTSLSWSPALDATVWSSTSKGGVEEPVATGAGDAAVATGPGITYLRLSTANCGASLAGR